MASAPSAFRLEPGSGEGVFDLWNRKEMSGFGSSLRNNKTRVYTSPTELLNAAADVFEHIEQSPFIEEVVGFHQGEACYATKNRMRPFTLETLLERLRLTKRQFNGYKQWSEAWADACERIEAVIYAQQVEGAAAGMLNPTVIKPLAGLVDKSEVKGGMSVTIEKDDADL